MDDRLNSNKPEARLNFSPTIINGEKITAFCCYSNFAVPLIGTYIFTLVSYLRVLSK